MLYCYRGDARLLETAYEPMRRYVDYMTSRAKDGIVSLTSAQLACLLDGIDWRNPQYSWRPQSAG